MENVLKNLKQKPITPGVHGLIDYGFALSLLAIPLLTKADKKTTKFYTMIAGQVFLYSALTKQPNAIKQLIPMRTHQKIDVVNLLGLAAFAGYKGVYRKKPTLAAHLGLLALGVTSVLLTNWKSKTK